MSHHGDSGIQEHSVGDYYPGGTYIKAGLGPGGTIVAWNLLTGEIYGEVQFEDWDKDYYEAHAKADALIPADLPYRSKQRQHVAEAVTSTDVASSRRNVMSKYTIPANERVLSDCLIAAINPRRVLQEVISFYENVVADDQRDKVDFEASECSAHPDCRDRFEKRTASNQFVLDGLTTLVAHADEQQAEIRAIEAGASNGVPAELQDLFAQLGINPNDVAVLQG